MSDDLNCKEVSRLLSAGLDQDLPSPQRARLRLHLVLCEACRELEQQMALLRRALRKVGSGRADPDDPAA